MIPHFRIDVVMYIEVLVIDLLNGVINVEFIVIQVVSQLERQVSIGEHREHTRLFQGHNA